MTEPQPFTETAFNDTVASHLEDNSERALALYRTFGPASSFSLARLLVHAMDVQKVEQALSALEAHEGDPSQEMFDRIFSEVICSKAAAAA